MINLDKCRIIAAVHNMDEFEEALKSNVQMIFALSTNIMNIGTYVAKAHEMEKLLFVHVDMTNGITKDSYGMGYIANTGVDGIISTRTNMIRLAKERGLKTVQRLFLIDAQSIKTSIESAKMHKPDFIEIMPGVVPKSVVRFKESLTIPIITGGLIETEDEIKAVIEVGAAAISTSKQELWNYRINAEETTKDEH